MTEIVADVLPLALAVALSPFPIVPAILVLFTPRARATGLGFLAGWVLGLVAATTVFVLLATVIELADEPPTWLSWVRVALGAALVVLGVKQWLGRHAETEPPAWMRSIDSLTPGKAVRLGFLLSAANPKILLLSAAAGLAIGAAELPAAETVAALVLYVAVAACTVALPIVGYLVLGDRLLAPLRRARTWLEQHNATVMAIVITVIGIVVLVNGVQGL